MVFVVVPNQIKVACLTTFDEIAMRRSRAREPARLRSNLNAYCSVACRNICLDHAYANVPITTVVQWALSLCLWNTCVTLLACLS